MPNLVNSRRFVALVACLTGLTAMGIDAVLPIFPEIIEAFQLPHEQHNRIQQVVFMYMLGFSLFQLLFGILADVMGRKYLLLFGIGVYSLASFAVLFTQQFESLLWLRFVQGAGLAAPRVLSMTIVRDVVGGREMSRILSFVTMVFLAVPALAPIIGQLIVLFAPWQGVFVMLTLLGVGLMGWIAKDLPETIKPGNRRPLSLKIVGQAIHEFLSNKDTLLYLLMITLLFTSLMTYIGQTEQILQKDIYRLGKLFPLAFATIVLGMIAASVTNARMVMRVGMRKIITFALNGLLLSDGVFWVVTLSGNGVMPLWLFLALLMIHFFFFGLSLPNLNALAINPYQHIGGTASALIGTLTSVFGVLFATFISRFYDATLVAMAYGFIACSVVLWLANFYLAYRYKNR